MVNYCKAFSVVIIITYSYNTHLFNLLAYKLTLIHYVVFYTINFSFTPLLVHPIPLLVHERAMYQAAGPRALL